MFEAYDRERGAVVALKTLERTDPHHLYRFKREFRELADVVHPRLVTLYELVSEGDTWFFTMELVPGEDFFSHIRGEAAPDPGRGSASGDDTEATLRLPASALPPAALDRLRPALLQLAQGVHALHAARRLHRDLKPSNVRVRPDGELVILDFGLVTPIRADGAGDTSAIAGTPAYMAPEQAAAETVTEATDWYAVGAMLFEVLTGRRPFVGPAADVMYAKRHRDAPSVRALCPDAPEDLAALCDDLLARDPAGRPSGDAVLARLGTRQRPAAPEAPREPFVGRDRELAALRDAYAATASGTAAVAWVHGPSGIGKSALVQRFLDELRAGDPDAVILQGRCYQQESVPYKGIDSAIDALSQFLLRAPRREVARYLPRHSFALAQVFPMFRQVPGVADAPERGVATGDGVELRRRAFGALRELLARIAARRPLVCFIDDVHWGDGDSGVLLSELVRPPDPPELLLIGAFRSEDRADSPLLRRFDAEVRGARLPITTVSLAPLRRDETRALARSLLPDDGDDRIEQIVRESDGSPFFVSELARSDHAGAPASLDDTIRARVAALPDAARRLLAVFAVAGRPTRPDIAIDASEVPREQAPAALALLRSAHLVRSRAVDGREHVEPYHDRIREAVADGLDAARRRACHARLAAALERWGDRYAEQLALHFLAVDDRAKAGRYAATAGARAAGALAYDRAVDLYQVALDCSGEDTARGLELLVALADALANSGRGREAGDAYLRAAQRATGQAALDLRQRGAQLLMMCGQIQAGLDAMDDVLAHYRMKRPRSMAGAIASLAWNSVRIRSLRRRFRPRPAAELDPAIVRRIDACWTLSSGVTGASPVLASAMAARGARLALAAGDAARTTITLGIHAAHMSGLSGVFPDEVFAVTRAAAEASGDRYAIAFDRAVRGMASYFCADFETTLVNCTASEAEFRESFRGVAWEIAGMQVLANFGRAMQGKYTDLIRVLPGQVREAEQRSDLFGAGTLVLSLGWIPHLARDAPDAALESMETYARQWDDVEMHYQHFFETMTRYYVAMYNRQWQHALSAIEERERALARAGHFRVRITDMLWSSYKAQAMLAVAHTQPARRRALHAGVLALVRRMRRIPWPAAQALADSAAACVLLARGREREALELLARAEADSERGDRFLSLAALRLGRGRLIGGSEGAALVASARDAFVAEGVQVPERLAPLLAPQPLYDAC